MNKCFHPPILPSCPQEWEKFMGKELLEELRLIIGNKPCTEEPAAAEGEEMDEMGEVRNHFCQSALNPQLGA